MPKGKPKPKPAASSAFDPTASVDNRASWLEPRTQDRYCRIHKTELDDTGFCRIAQAWWVPKFACPGCHGWLWDNGFCPTCTPRTQTFPGDYFEQRWGADAGREYGHFVRVYAGPSPACDGVTIAGFLAELHAIAPKIGRAVGQTPTREMGDEAEVPF
jgi:hypothetical protein